jgi:hypothetical protein
MGIFILSMSRKIVSMSTFTPSMGKKVLAMSIYPYIGKYNRFKIIKMYPL